MTGLFCGSCGTELPPNAKFCNECGAPVTQVSRSGWERATGIADALPAEDPNRAARYRTEGRRCDSHRLREGLLKAEIVSYDDLIAAGSITAAKAAGKVRIEGKDYVMADGDVVEFRFQTTSGGKAAAR